MTDPSSGATIVLEIGGTDEQDIAARAGDLLRAVQLAERYLADALSDRYRTKLEQLHVEAEAEITRAAAASPHVVAIAFILNAT
ncbi:MAG: hypothetical protein ABW061_06355 [Polyangiaceae bacterium]